MPVRGYPWPVISDLEAKQTVEAFCFNVDMASGRARRDRMLDRIFHNRLQDKMRQSSRERHWFDFKDYCQPVSKADLFDLEIATKEFSFFFQSDQLLIGIFEGYRRKSPSRAIMLFAFGGSSKTSDEIEWSVLKRKCG
jgi:hypothetical protein